MPFDPCMGHTGMRVDRVDDALHTPRDDRTGIVHAISHRVAGAHHNREVVLCRQLHQLLAERHDIPVDIRPRDIFQMTPHADAFLETVPHDGQIMFHRLAPRHPELQENVIIRTAHKNTRLLHADLLHQLEVLLARADPRSHLRELIAALHTFVDCIPVLLAVQEKLALADHAVRTAKPVQIIVDRHDLFSAVRRP